MYPDPHLINDSPSTAILVSLRRINDFNLRHAGLNFLTPWTSGLPEKISSLCLLELAISLKRACLCANFGCPFFPPISLQILMVFGPPKKEILLQRFRSVIFK